MSPNVIALGPCQVPRCPVAALKSGWGSKPSPRAYSTAPKMRCWASAKGAADRPDGVGEVEEDGAPADGSLRALVPVVERGVDEIDTGRERRPHRVGIVLIGGLVHVAEVGPDANVRNRKRLGFAKETHLLVGAETCGVTCSAWGGGGAWKHLL